MLSTCKAAGPAPMHVAHVKRVCVPAAGGVMQFTGLSHKDRVHVLQGQGPTSIGAAAIPTTASSRPVCPDTSVWLSSRSTCDSTTVHACPACQASCRRSQSISCSRPKPCSTVAPASEHVVTCAAGSRQDLHQPARTAPLLHRICDQPCHVLEAQSVGQRR